MGTIYYGSGAGPITYGHRTRPLAEALMGDVEEGGVAAETIKERAGEFSLDNVGRRFPISTPVCPGGHRWRWKRAAGRPGTKSNENCPDTSR